MPVDIYEDMELLFNRGGSLVDFYRNYPILAAYDLLKVDLAPIQRIVLNDMWFKNYCISVAGRGFGKSQDINSLTHFDNKGLVYLYEELPPIPSYLSDGEEEIIDWDDRIYTSEGFKPTKRLCLESNIEGKRIETYSGFVNRGSNHHPLLTINDNCDFIYKSLSDFIPGDTVCIQRNQNIFGGLIIDSADAYLIGLFVGCGCVDINDNQSVISSELSIKNFCIDYCINNKVDYKITYDKRTESADKILFEEFDYFFYKYKINKLVPYSIRTSSRESQISFLQGYFDINSDVNTDGSVSCCSLYRKLLEEIQLMLLNFGITSRLYEKRIKSELNKSYFLDISSEDAYRFKELIGFTLYRKQNILDSYYDTEELDIDKAVIPYVFDLCAKISKYYDDVYKVKIKPNLTVELSNKNELTYKSIVEFLTQCKYVINNGFDLVGVKHDIEKLYNILYYNYYFDTIVSVDDWKGDCYDFEISMDGEPNYFTNGFINHNTFLLGINAVLHAMLYPGYRIGLIGPSFRQSLVLSDTCTTFWTDEGLKSTPIEFYNSIKSNHTLVQSSESQNKIVSKWENPDRACRYIKTTKGFELSGTVDHAIQVLDDKCNIVFKDLQDVSIDDNIVIKTGFNYFGNDNILPKCNLIGDWRTNSCKFPTELTSDMSYLFGLIIGDGCVSYKPRKYRVNFTSIDDDLLEYFKKYMCEYFGIDNVGSYQKTDAGCIQLNISNKNLCDFLIECGFTSTTALDKKIPTSIKKASKENIVNFLSGLFDTDGSCYTQNYDHYNSCEVSLSTSSLQLAKEVQSVLLNLGIISSFCVSGKACRKKLIGRDKYSECATSYKVRITWYSNLIKFRDIIGFRCEYKLNKLNGFINGLKNRKRTHSIVYDLGLPKNIISKDYDKFLEYKNKGFYFVKMVESDYFFAPTIDAEVENESCYWAGGFINHNSKMIFAEVEKLYQRAPLLREATEKKPTRGADTCFLKFKGTDISNGSYIEALPIGVDGAKIRGSRFYLIEIDELAQMPTDIIDMVIRPMAAVQLEPMLKVREIERIQKLIDEGLATEDDMIEDSANKMIMTSSGYYKFNHMWHRMKSYWKAMKEEGTNTKYAVHQVPYQMLPKGFLDMNNVNEARRTMSNIEFMMEYEAAMVADSEGFFKASLLESCTRDSDFTIKLRGESGKEYILGIDPNQGGSALFGLIVVELGSPNKIVYVRGIKKQSTQEMTKSVQRLISSFNIVRIFMDAQGGGNAIKDLLAEGYGDNTPILDMDDDDTKYLHGRRILRMINFSPTWISDANFDTLSLLENNRLRFPNIPRTSSEIEERMYDEVKMLKSQMLSIIVTETARGVRHFDTPKKGQNKDLYSAMILASYGVKEMTNTMERVDPKLTEGLIRHHSGTNTFTSNKITGVGKDYMKDAVLQRKL